MEIFDLMVNKFKQKVLTEETDLDNFLVEHDFDAVMNLFPHGCLCIFGVQYMIGSSFSCPLILKPSFSEYVVLSSMISCLFFDVVLYIEINKKTCDVKKVKEKAIYRNSLLLTIELYECTCYL